MYLYVHSSKWDSYGQIGHRYTMYLYVHSSTWNSYGQIGHRYTMYLYVHSSTWDSYGQIGHRYTMCPCHYGYTTKLGHPWMSTVVHGTAMDK